MEQKLVESRLNTQTLVVDLFQTRGFAANTNENVQTLGEFFDSYFHPGNC